MSVSGLKKKLAGLAFWLRLQGLSDFTKEFWVGQALKVYWRSKLGRDARRPVSFELLGRTVAQLDITCSSGYEVVLFKVAFALAFFGAFRISELVSPSKKKNGGLGVMDVSCGEDRLSILVTKSKTNQRGKGITVQVFFFHCQVLPCAQYNWCGGFLAIRPGGWGGPPLLVHQDGLSLSHFSIH